VQFLFVMDPAQKMIPDKDTTFALIRGTEALGHQAWHCLPTDVFNVGRDVFARARPIRVSDAPPHSVLSASSVVELSALDAVFVRRDPPFDAEYMHLTQQLDLVKDRTLVVNDPRGLRDANEKLFAFHFFEFMPRSLVTADRERILTFVRESGGRAVLKPLDGAGGSGVVLLSTDDRNTRSLVDLLTDEGRRLALAQEYEPSVRAGDKRVLVLDGEPLGAILRVPREDDLRANIHVGGRVEPTELTPEEEHVARAVGEKLRAYGLWFSGLDLIGGRLIEVNVTSPTGIQELGRFSGTTPEQDVIRWAEARAANRGKVGPPARGGPA
jgi:glutathione synthase